MESKQLKSMSTDQLMDLYQKVQLMLADKLRAEIAKIEDSSAGLSQSAAWSQGIGSVARTRLSFPNTRTLETQRRFGLAGVDDVCG